jgi:uncharacterized protein YjbK
LTIKKTISIEDYQNLKKKELLIQAIENRKTNVTPEINENMPNLDRKHFTLRRKKLALKIQLKFFQMNLSKPAQKSLSGFSQIYDKGSMIEDSVHTRNKIETPVSYEDYIPRIPYNDINYKDLSEEDKLESKVNS